MLTAASEGTIFAVQVGAKARMPDGGEWPTGRPANHTGRREQRGKANWLEENERGCCKDWRSRALRLAAPKLVMQNETRVRAAHSSSLLSARVSLNCDPS